MMLTKTPSLTPSKVLLIAERRGTSPDAATLVRRYRIARLRLEGRAPDPAARLEHLKRIYD